VRSRRWPWATWLLLATASLVTLLPFALSVLTAFKTPAQFAAQSPLALPDPWTLENVLGVLGGRIRFDDALATTTLAAAFLIVTQVPFSVLAAYAFALLRFPGRTVLFWAYVATLMVPATVLVLPLFLMVSAVGLADTFWGLVLPFALGSPYAIFLLRQHFRGIPAELLEAARMDGLGPFGILTRIVLPLSRPAVATVAVITIVTQFNSFLWPRVIAGTDWQTLTVATANAQTQYRDEWTLVMAATTLTIVPLLVLFVIFQRNLTRSLAVVPA
jgi:multiple sugar transport system permease protein